MIAKWRAKASGRYWFISNRGNVLHSSESGITRDNIRYEAGNYFETQELAKASLIKGLILQRATYL